MKAIVYISNAGHTAAYGEILAEQTGLPLLRLEEAMDTLPPKTEIIYLGWLFVGTVKDYKKAAKRWNVQAVCGVGLCDTGALVPELRKAMKLPEQIPAFTMQGGMDYEKLDGIYRHMIDVLIKVLSVRKHPGEGEKQMLALLKKGGNYVSSENTAAFMQWYRTRQDLAASHGEIV